MSQPNFIANGTINPSTFVVMDTSVNKAVDAASATTQFIIGVSQEFSEAGPVPGASSVAANAGDPIKVYCIGDTCLLNATTAGWTAGDRLTANASGFGVTASGSNYYGAIALTTMTGAGLGQVQVLLGKNP